MPFTLAHPALPLILKKSSVRFSTTALVIGSLVPDFENFFRMREIESISHHALGILIFDIPVGLISCFVFHNLMKDSFISNLPSFFRKRFLHALKLNWNRFAIDHKWIVLYSLLTGIFLHLFWDGFTHHDGIFVSMLPVLAVEWHLFNYAFPVFFILQIISSIVGLMVLYIMIAHLPVQIPDSVNKYPEVYYWLIFVMLIIMIMAARVYIWHENVFYLSLVKAFMGACVYAWIIISIGYKILKPNAPLLNQDQY